MPNPATLTEEFFFLVAVEVLTPQQKRAHLELGSKKRRRFRESVYDLYRYRGGEDEYDIHHVVPLQLGGADRLNNLVLCERSYHIKIHNYLNKQINKFGCAKGFVYIPRQTGLMWQEPCRPDWKDGSFEAYNRRYPYIGDENVLSVPAHP